MKGGKNKKKVKMLAGGKGGYEIRKKKSGGHGEGTQERRKRYTDIFPCY